MSESFAEAASHACAVAARLLGWRPAEFWQATPTELAMAVADPAAPAAAFPPSRDLIASLMERDAHG